MYRLTIAAFFLLFVNSCKKEVLNKDRTGDPVFFMEGEINGQIVRLAAGDEDLFMHTDYTEGTENSAGIFGGSISDYDQNSKSQLFGLKLRNKRFSLIGHGDLIETLTQLELEYYYDNFLTYYPVNFNLQNSDPVKNVTWDFGDNMNSSAADPKHFYPSDSYKKYRK